MIQEPKRVSLPAAQAIEKYLRQRVEQQASTIEQQQARIEELEAAERDENGMSDEA
jgi:predicted ribosome quality control (RQC) complex YloA/Tae2 family protein